MNPNKEKNLETEFEKEDAVIVETQKQKVIKRIAENKLTQVKMKAKAQKKKNEELDKEIEEIQRNIEKKLRHNEDMSKRAKELKALISSRVGSGAISQSKEAPSPKLSDAEQEEL
jgi:DNA-binding transcriptional regulator GbsR (MarR family)